MSADPREVVGSRWLHVWHASAGGTDGIALSIQYEHSGIRISAAPYVIIPASCLSELYDLLAVVPGAVRDDRGVSLPLGE